jgi:single-stranded DNA-binding protein
MVQPSEVVLSTNGKTLANIRRVEQAARRQAIRKLPMPQNNFIHLSGNLADDPYFEMLRGEKGKTPYIRFDLVVERDLAQAPREGAADVDAPISTPGQPKQADSTPERHADLIRVTGFGVHAWVDFFYLKKGAYVCISGWLQSRRYFDRGTKKMRRIMEVNAQKISYGRGCDFERGERQRANILAQLESERTPIPSDLRSEPLAVASEELAIESI